MLFLAYSMAFFDSGKMDIEILSTSLFISEYHIVLFYFAECLSQIGLPDKKHRLCFLNKTLFLRVLETDSPLPSLQISLFSMCSYVGGRQRASFVMSLIRLPSS